MMSSLRSLFAPKDRGPRRSSLVTLEVPEAFEARVVLSVSIASTIDGLKPPVLSLTLPQPPATGSQVVSLTLRPSSADPRLFKDAVTGKLLKKIEITLSDKGIGTTDTITLTNALISSFKVVTAPNGNVTDVISLVGRTVSSGSLAATIDGLKPPVLSLTLPQPPATGSLASGMTSAQSSSSTSASMPSGSRPRSTPSAAKASSSSSSDIGPRTETSRRTAAAVASRGVPTIAQTLPGNSPRPLLPPPRPRWPDPPPGTATGRSPARSTSSCTNEPPAQGDLPNRARSRPDASGSRHRQRLGRAELRVDFGDGSLVTLRVEGADPPHSCYPVQAGLEPTISW